MKKIFQVSFLAFLGISLFVSCAKKTDTPTPVVTNNPAMSATINGVGWSAGTVAGTLNSGMVVISAVASTGSSNLGLVISSTAPGTYTIGAGNDGIVYGKDASTSYTSTSGTIVVSSYSNNIISGTFEGSCMNISGGSDVATITKGTFTAKIQ